MINTPPKQWFSGLSRQNMPQLQFKGLTLSSVNPQRKDRKFQKLFNGALPKISNNIRNAIFNPPQPKITSPSSFYQQPATTPTYQSPQQSQPLTIPTLTSQPLIGTPEARQRLTQQRIQQPTQPSAATPSPQLMNLLQQLMIMLQGGMR